MDIHKIDLCTRIWHVTSYGNRIKETFVYFYIFKCNIFQSYPWLSFTCPFLIKRIKHTSRSISIWLFHLLRSYINCPPDGSIHSKVFVINICDISITLIARICLNIDTFQRSFLNDVSKSNISDTASTNMRRDTSNRKTNT